MEVHAQDGGIHSSWLHRFKPPQVQLSRSNVVTDDISDRYFETEILQWTLGSCLPTFALAVAFVPPQVQLSRANIATDSISDRYFAKPQKPTRKRPGPARRVQARDGLRRLRTRLAQLDFVPPQVQQSRPNIATDSISDRQFQDADESTRSVDPPPPPPPLIARPPKARRHAEDFSTEANRSITKFGIFGCCAHSASCTSCEVLTPSEARTNDIVKLASSLQGNKAANRDDIAEFMQNCLLDDIPNPRQMPAGCGVLEAVEPTVMPLASNSEQPQCQIELSDLDVVSRSSTEQVGHVPPGDTFVMRCLADAVPGVSSSIGDLNDLSGKRGLRRYPSLAKVCIACRPILRSFRGRWLQYCVCPHRLREARRPLPPQQMLLLRERPRNRESRQRGRWSHLDGKWRKRCVHGFRVGFGVKNAGQHGVALRCCPKCRPRCKHGKKKEDCSICLCIHGKPKEKCGVCSGCIHGRARGSCLTCSGCSHGKLRFACVLCNPCPHGRLRQNCTQCRACIHGRIQSQCAECSPCPHEQVKFMCLKCYGCEHGVLERFCKICIPCPHGRRKAHCSECNRCSHGVLRHNCRHCSGCPHGRVRRFCVECNPCPHGKRKQACKICSGCAHGRIKDSCKDCKGCPHGKVKRFCSICNACVHGRLRKSCKICNGCPHGRVKDSCKDCKAAKSFQPQPLLIDSRDI